MRPMRTILLCLLAILWTAFIWSNSAKPAVESAGQSMLILEQVKGILLSLGFEEAFLHTLVRKSAHVVEFAVLGGLWMTFARRQWPHERKFALILVFATCLMTALIDETIQLAFEGRAGMIQDLWVDLSGVVFAMGLIELMLAWKRAKRR